MNTKDTNAIADMIAANTYTHVYNDLSTQRLTNTEKLIDQLADYIDCATCRPFDREAWKKLAAGK